jgi:phosphatidylglycerol:prolipoprotein diacylglycerol transferase
VNPIAFRIGPLAVHWYGILIVTGALAAAFVAQSEAKRRRQNPSHVWDALTLCLLFGIVGARLYHVLTPPPSMGVDIGYYFRNPKEIFAPGMAGLGIYGAVAGGILAVFVYTRYQKLDFFQWLDIAAPGLALAQAIGRWANFINQELYGQPTDLPWAIYIPLEKRLPGYEAFERFHPTFLYESLWNLGVCLFLLYIARRYSSRLLRGELFGLYLILYPLGRFLLEMIRLDSPMMGSLSIAQVIALIAISVSAGAMAYRRWGKKGVEETGREDDHNSIPPNRPGPE